MRVVATLMLGFVLLDSGAAVAHRRFASEIRPLSIGLLKESGMDAYQTGKSLLALNNVPEALAAFPRALIANPNSVDALNGVAVCYDHLGRPDVSRGFYETALLIAPDDAVTLNNYGFALMMAGDRSAARAPLERAAAGDLAEPSAAALRTLALLDAATPEAPKIDATQAAPVARLERTSEGEQRLVLASAATSAADTASDEPRMAALTVLAPAWSVADDERLSALAQADIRAGADRARAVLLARSEPAPEPSLPSAERAHAPGTAATTIGSAALLALFTAPAPTAIAGEREPSWRSGAARTRAAQSDTLTTSELAALAPVRGRTEALTRFVRIEEGPVPEPVRAAVFDSDDDELNRFAERMHAGSSKHGVAARAWFVQQGRAT